MPTTPHKPSSNSTTVCRIFPVGHADHEGKRLIELVSREPTGAVYVQQHRVEPPHIHAFVVYQQQQLPNVSVEYISDPSGLPSQSNPGTNTNTQPTAPTTAYPPKIMSYHQTQPATSKLQHSPHQQSANLSTSTIGGLSGYDKYGSSFGLCSWNSSSASSTSPKTGVPYNTPPLNGPPPTGGNRHNC